MPNPAIETGQVIVNVVAAPALPYASEVLSGEWKYLLELSAVSEGAASSVGYGRS